MALVERLFQPTLPARGATRRPREPIGFQIISTHAPRTGSDVPRAVHRDAHADFNPRSPHGERLQRHIQRHPDNLISTHAPRTGSDRATTSSGFCWSNFNPRSPHGERLEYSSHRSMLRLFQPTLPARGATGRLSKSRTRSGNFNPRSPHGERRDCFAFADFVKFAFQPTLPARGATMLCPCCRNDHTFQPTLPARGATYGRTVAASAAMISTHAPRTGSDASLM